MTEWRLFEQGTTPDFTTPEFFAAHPWVPPEQQGGHTARIEMVAHLVCDIVEGDKAAFHTISDLGCGDGSLLTELMERPTTRGLGMWGYDAGTENVKKALEKGHVVAQANLLTDRIDCASIAVASEVVEHLLDPHGFLQRLPSRYLVISSPSAENDEWHYLHHAWAWDLDGYEALVTGAGWTIIEHLDVDGGPNYHNGIERPQRFQAISARRA